MCTVLFSFQHKLSIFFLTEYLLAKKFFFYLFIFLFHLYKSQDRYDVGQMSSKVFNVLSNTVASFTRFADADVWE